MFIFIFSSIPENNTSKENSQTFVMPREHFPIQMRRIADEFWHIAFEMLNEHMILRKHYLTDTQQVLIFYFIFI